MESFWLVLLASPVPAPGLHLLYRLPHAAVQTYDFEQRRFEFTPHRWLVEVNGTPVGPHVLTPNTGDPCITTACKLGTRRIGWQEEMDSRFDESLCVPFFLERHRRVLVDPQAKAWMCTAISATSECFGSLVAELYGRLRNFLRRAGRASEKIKLDERIFRRISAVCFERWGKQNMNASIPRLKSAALRTVLQLSSRRRHAHVSMSSKRALNADKYSRSQMRLAAFRPVHVETRVTRMGIQLTLFNKNPSEHPRPPCRLPQQFFRAPSASSAPAGPSPDPQSP